MKVSAPLALSALLTVAMANPVERRGDDLNPDVVVETVIDEVIVTIDVTTTITGSPIPVATHHGDHMAYHANGGAAAHVHQEAPASSSSAAAVPVVAPVAPVAPKEDIVVKPSSTTPAPAPAPAYTPPPVTPPTGSSAEDIQDAKNKAQEDLNAAQGVKNDQQKAADFAHQNQMEQLQNGGPAAAPPVPGPSAAAAPASPPPSQPQTPPPSSGSGGGSGGSGCGSIGGQCIGDLTIYNNKGLGACGWENNTNTEDFFALSYETMGPASNDGPGGHKNPFCGRMAEIDVGGKKFTGMLTDKCPGCPGQSLDLSQHLFSQIYPDEKPGNGHYFGITWHFTSGEIYHM